VLRCMIPKKKGKKMRGLTAFPGKMRDAGEKRVFKGMPLPKSKRGRETVRLIGKISGKGRKRGNAAETKVYLTRKIKKKR